MTGSLKLTEAGEEKAKRIYERHTILSRLLMKLGADEKTAQEDACRMEHRIYHALPYYEFGYMKNQTKPNAWPTGLGFGFVWFGAANRTQTGTDVAPVDFK